MPWKRLELRQLVALKSRQCWLAAFSDVSWSVGDDLVVSRGLGAK